MIRSLTIRTEWVLFGPCWHGILTVIDYFDIRSKKSKQVVRLRQPRSQEPSSVRFLCVPMLSVKRQTSLTEKISWCWSTCCHSFYFPQFTPSPINDIYSDHPKMIRVKRKLKKLLSVDATFLFLLIDDRQQESRNDMLNSSKKKKILFYDIIHLILNTRQTSLKFLIL